MSTIPYLQRLGQLKQESEQEAAAKMGLPLQQPSVPVEAAPPKEMLGTTDPGQKQDPMEEAMQSQFGRNVKNFSDGDTRFQQMMAEYTKLANGLREQVQSGYMPEALARKKLEQFIGDSGNYFKSHKASPIDNPQIAGALEGLMSNMPQDQAGEGQLPQGSPSETQDPAQIMPGGV